jgi:hypothetical protein
LPEADDSSAEHLVHDHILSAPALEACRRCSRYLSVGVVCGADAVTPRRLRPAERLQPRPEAGRGQLQRELVSPHRLETARPIRHSSMTFKAQPRARERVLTYECRLANWGVRALPSQNSPVSGPMAIVYVQPRYLSDTLSYRADGGLNTYVCAWRATTSLHNPRCGA